MVSVVKVAYSCILIGLLAVLVSSGVGATTSLGDTLDSQTQVETQVGEKSSRVINISTEKASIYLSSQQLTVEDGESANLQFSATNFVTNKKQMTVQLIIQAPSGVSVTGVSDVDEGGNQLVTTDTIAPGDEMGVRVSIDPEAAGEYPITAKAVYYFGTDRSNGGGKEVEMSVVQQPPPKSHQEKAVTGLSSTVGALLSYPAKPLQVVQGALPPETTPLMPGLPSPLFTIRLNIIYGFINFLSIWILSMMILDTTDGGIEDGGVELTMILAGLVAPILMLIQGTRLFLALSILLVLVGILIFLGLGLFTAIVD